MKAVTVVSDINGEIIQPGTGVRVRITPFDGDVAYVLDCTSDDVASLTQHARQVGRQGRPKQKKDQQVEEAVA